jgi:hypothetical protein
MVFGGASDNLKKKFQGGFSEDNCHPYPCSFGQTWVLELFALVSVVAWDCLLCRLALESIVSIFQFSSSRPFLYPVMNSFDAF